MQSESSSAVKAGKFCCNQ